MTHGAFTIIRGAVGAAEFRLCVTALGLLFCASALAQDGFVRLEAEDMSLSGFRTEDVSGSSEGTLINLKGRAVEGTATTTFSGNAGSYDIFVGYHDEQDGTAELEVSIGGASVDSWQLDSSPGGTQPSAQNFLIRQIADDRAVNSGDAIEIAGVQGVWDNANVDYIEFVPSDGGPPPPPAAGERIALVAKSGGDYTTLTDALDNLDDGDQWCRPPTDDEEPDVGCLIKLAPGEYEEPTVRIPSKVSVIGSGRDITTIVGVPGGPAAVRLAPTSEEGGDMLLRDLTIRIRTTDGSPATGIVTSDRMTARIENVDVFAQSSGLAIAVQELDGPLITYRNVRFSARGGSDRTVALQALSTTTISDCLLTAFGSSETTGVRVLAELPDDTATLRMSGCEVRVNGSGQSAVGIDLVYDESVLELAHSKIRVDTSADSNTGIAGRGFDSRIEANDLVVTATSFSGSPVNTGIAWTHSGEATFEFRAVRASASGGSASRGIVLTAASDSTPISIVDSTFDGGQGAQQRVGLALEQPGDVRINVDGSKLIGSTASLSAPALPTGGRVRIGSGQLAGPLVVPATATDEVRCAGVYDEDYNLLGSDCEP